MSFLILKSVPRKRNRKFGQGRGWPRGLERDYGSSPLPKSNQSTAQPCYLVDPPQEFDEEGKELDNDAQVWRTYVKEADRVDEELVDGWNKSMDVNLIFAALFSAISTAFVIESYKNLKQDPADVSSQTLLVISQTLSLLANRSQTTDVPPAPVMDGSPFKASPTAICVNVLWFLSLSLSVAVSLVSMLAKEWCLEFMSGRIGPPGAQARRRQRRWDGVVGWRMKEVLVVLPSLIHLSLLLFAVGLCVFLWDVHYGVAIPVVIVTTLSAGTYFACTILPYIDEYCPYGTVLSRLYKQFSNKRAQSVRDTMMRDETTSRALHWMIVNCETPRSVDVALQSLAAGRELPPDILEKCDAWTLIHQRIKFIGADSDQATSANLLYKRALESHVHMRRKADGFAYVLESMGPLAGPILGVQSCINSAIHDLLGQLSPFDQRLAILEECKLIGLRVLEFEYYIMRNKTSEERPRGSLIPWRSTPIEYEENIHTMRSTSLAKKVTQLLANGMKENSDMEPLMQRVLSASLVLLLCRQMLFNRVGVAGYVRALIQAYHAPQRSGTNDVHVNINIHYGTHELNRATLALLFGVLSISQCDCSIEVSPYISDQPDGNFPFPILNRRLGEALEVVWEYLINFIYPGTQSFSERRYVLHGAFHLLTRAGDYGLNSEDCLAVLRFIDGYDTQDSRILHLEVDDKCYPLHIQEYTTALAASPDLDNLPPQLLMSLKYLVPMAGRLEYIQFTPELYVLVLKTLCQTGQSWNFEEYGTLLLYSPFPKASPPLVDLLSTSGVTSWLVDALECSDIMKQAFAFAQLWLLFNMSAQAFNCPTDTLSKLDTMLLRYPGLGNSFEGKKQAMEDLESRLIVLLDDFYPHPNTRAYLYRVLECMLQRRSTPLPKRAYVYLEGTPDCLRGIASFVDMAAETSELSPVQNENIKPSHDGPPGTSPNPSVAPHSISVLGL